MTVPAVEYWSNVADELFPLDFRVSPDGRATLQVSSNRDVPEGRSVGRFQASLEPARLTGLLQAVRAPGLAALGTPGPLPPGSAVRKLTIQEQGKPAVVRLASDEAPTPPAFKAAEDQVSALMTYVRGHPLEALGIRVMEVPGELRRRKAMDVTLTLANTGSKPLQLPHPRTWEEEGTEVQLRAIRSDIPLAELREEHQFFEDLVPGLQPLKLSAAATVTLAPGQELGLQFRSTPEWGPGTYEVQLSMAVTLRDGEGGELGRVELVSVPATLRVER